MYRVIAYHGIGDKKEIANDLRLLWDDIRSFMESGDVQHIYCFRVVQDDKRVNLLLIVQYGLSFEAKPRVSDIRDFASNSNRGIDYWFYVRERRESHK